MESIVFTTIQLNVVGVKVTSIKLFNKRLELLAALG